MYFQKIFRLGGLDNCRGGLRRLHGLCALTSRTALPPLLEASVCRGGLIYAWGANKAGLLQAWEATGNAFVELAGGGFRAVCVNTSWFSPPVGAQ